MTINELATGRKKWGTTKIAAQYLDCSESLLAKDRISGLLGIPFCRLGRHIRYNLDDLDAYLESQKTGGSR